MNVIVYMERDYENKTAFGLPKKQSQTKPIRIPNRRQRRIICLGVDSAQGPDGNRIAQISLSVHHLSVSLFRRRARKVA